MEDICLLSIDVCGSLHKMRHKSHIHNWDGERLNHPVQNGTESPPWDSDTVV